MQCTRCEELLFEGSESPLGDARSAAVESHLAECPKCSALAESLRRPTALDQVPGADFTASVLGLTTAVAPLERAQRQLDRDLPALATLAPDDDFVADVMAATVEADRGRLLHRAAAAWAALVQRPRFALEGAYLGSVAVFLLVGMPWSPLAGVPEQVMGELRADSQTARATLAKGTERLTQFSQVTLTRAGQELSERFENVLPDGLTLISTDTETPRWRDIAREWVDSLLESIIALGSWLMGPWIPSETYEITTPNPESLMQEKEPHDDRSSHSA